MNRREDLVGAATDYVLEAGLIGLSLRPMATALGTSDRMLNYHFGSKDELIASVLRESSDRSAAQIGELKPAASIRQAVVELWVAISGPEQQRCQRMYVEAAALGLFGSEPYASVVREANAIWIESIRGYLVASGAPTRRVKRMATVMEAALMGFQLDLPLDEDNGDMTRAVKDLAEAIEFLATC